MFDLKGRLPGIRGAIAAAVLAIAIAAPAAAQAPTVIRIGTEGAYSPFNFFGSDGQLQGFDIDIANAVCAEMAATCEFVAQDWEGMIPALIANRYDAIIASMSITDERKQQVDFTDKYYTNSLRFVAAKGSPLADFSPAGLAGKRLGAQASTISLAYLQDNYSGATVQQYPTQDEAYRDLASGRLDAVLADFGVSYLWLATPEGACCDYAGETLLANDEIGIAVRKEDTALRDRLNAALVAIIANGKHAEITAKYFPFSIY